MSEFNIMDEAFMEEPGEREEQSPSETIRESCRIIRGACDTIMERTLGTGIQMGMYAEGTTEDDVEDWRVFSEFRIAVGQLHVGARNLEDAFMDLTEAPQERLAEEVTNWEGTDVKVLSERELAVFEEAEKATRELRLIWQEHPQADEIAELWLNEVKRILEEKIMSSHTRLVSAKEDFINEKFPL